MTISRSRQCENCPALCAAEGPTNVPVWVVCWKRTRLVASLIGPRNTPGKLAKCWYLKVNKNSGHIWTVNPDKATMFTSRVDAEEFTLRLSTMDGVVICRTTASSLALLSSTVKIVEDDGET